MSEKKLLALFAKQTQALKAATDDAEEFHRQCLAVAQQMQQAFAVGNKVLVAGNGGSAAEAQHLSDEMVGRYAIDRRPYPVISLTADSAVITCIGNDFGYEQVFSRQIEALGQEGDMFIGLTTSGTSTNILLAAKKAREVGMTVVALTGPKGTFKDIADYAVIAPSEINPRMQEFHLHAIHLICEAFEHPDLITDSLS
ncbi:MAG: SIS domain-containing protein [Candidatus Andersenbacteria bacterium]